MNDAQFYNELWIRCYIDQIDGYPFGHPGRIVFRPIVPSIPNNRKATLEMVIYAGKFTPEQVELLLADEIEPPTPSEPAAPDSE